MNKNELLQLLLAGLFAVANLPSLVHLLKHHRRHRMPVLTQFEVPIAELNAAASSISQVVADLKAQVGNAPSAEDINDTLAAVQTAADAVKAAVGQ